MYFPIFLAHGALGNWDELIFLGVVSIFFILMGVSWVRSRAQAENPTVADPFGDPSGETIEEADSTERFKLD